MKSQARTKPSRKDNSQSSPTRFCDGITRRSMIQLGIAGTLGTPLSLSQCLQAEEQSEKKRDVSLLILFLHGGLSTIDTLDLKPEAPSEIRGEFQPISTSVTGLQVCEHLPKLAKVAKHFSLIRSMTHSNSSHGFADHYMLTGYHPTAGFNVNLKPNNQRPSHGSIIAKKLGPQGSVPPYVCLPRLHNSAGSAYLGSSAAPFVVDADPNSPRFAVPDLNPPLQVNANRLEQRKELIQTIDRYRQTEEQQCILQANRNASQMNFFRTKAFDLMTSRQTRLAFDIHQESKEMRDRYGRTSLGQACLMGRRLIEAGVRCVTIDHSNWDTHYNNFHVLKHDLLPQLDTGVSMLLADLSTRGLLETTLVVVMGEFGRTPRVNKDAGRDHWGPSNTILLAGGGIQPGRVIGATNSKGEKPASDPLGPEDLSATMFHLVGIDHTEVFYTPEGRPVPIANEGKVIRELL